MIKKISALLLALVLCLSVVVVPASALELAAGKNIAFELVWDKENYSAGDTAVLSVYMKASEAYELCNFTMTIALSTAQIKEAAEGDYGTVKENTVYSELWESFFKDPGNTTISFLTETSSVGAKIEAANTADEKALYDTFNKFVMNRNYDGSHDNAANKKRGLPGADINASEEPIIQITYTVADGVEDGTTLNAAITAGSVTMSPAQTTFKYIKKPGAGTTTATYAASTIDVSAAAAEAEIGAASTPFPTETIVNPLKGQIRFHKNDDGKYAEKFDVRALAVISGADFNATFGSVEAAESMIKEAGFVFAAGSNVANPTFDAVKGLVEDGTAADGYTKKAIEFISTSTQPGDYVFSCIVTDMDDADKANSLVAVGYLAVDTDADDVADDYYYYTDVQTISFTELYNTYYGTAFGA